MSASRGPTGSTRRRPVLGFRGRPPVGARRARCLAGAVHEAGHVLVGRTGQHFGRTGHSHKFSGPHDRHAVAQPNGFVQIMRHEQHRPLQLLLQMRDLVLHFPPNERIQAAERFVHEQNGGSLASARAMPTRCCMPPDSCEGSGEASPEAPPEPAPPPPGPAASVCPRLSASDRMRRFPAPSCEAAARNAGTPCPPCPAETGSAPGIQRSHFLSVDDNSARGRLHQPQQTPNERGFSAARQPHDDEKLALFQRQADAAHPATPPASCRFARDSGSSGSQRNPGGSNTFHKLSTRSTSPHAITSFSCRRQRHGAADGSAAAWLRCVHPCAAYKRGLHAGGRVGVQPLRPQVFIFAQKPEATSYASPPVSSMYASASFVWNSSVS